ncbi:MAG: hypothetical protein HY719_10725 [Planctomycetes bacterium]|nr:hypothetical protein [Planctomycetota bacterium]
MADEMDDQAEADAEADAEGEEAAEEEEAAPDDEAPATPKKRRKPGFETALLGCAALALSVAIYATTYRGWSYYDLKWAGLYPEKVKPENRDNRANVLALYAKQGVEGALAVDVRLDDITEANREPFFNEKVWYVTLNKGANNGVQEGEIWTVNAGSEGEVQLVVCQVFENTSVAHVRTAWNAMGEGRSAPTIKVSSVEGGPATGPEATKVSADKQWILKKAEPTLIPGK